MYSVIAPADSAPARARRQSRSVLPFRRGLVEMPSTFIASILSCVGLCRLAGYQLWGGKATVNVVEGLFGGGSEKLRRWCFEDPRNESAGPHKACKRRTRLRG